jgi:hypothetical protein
MTTDAQAIRERMDAITGFEAINYPNAGLTGRRELAELGKDGRWRLWDKNVPYSWEALTFIEHAPADIRFLLSEVERLETALTASEARCERLAGAKTETEWLEDKLHQLSYMSTATTQMPVKQWLQAELEFAKLAQLAQQQEGSAP